MTSSTALRGDIFKNVKYFLNDSIARDSREQYETLLTEHGASVAIAPTMIKGEWKADNNSFYALARFDMEECTHVITDSFNFPEADLVRRWNAAQEDESKRIITCTPTWVTRSITLGLQDPLHYSPDPAKIFSGVFLHCFADLPKGDREALYGLVNALGGQQREAVTKDATHIACLTKNEQMYNIIKDTGLGIKFILPHWFDACISMQQKVDDEPFLFTDELPAMLRPETWGSEVLYEKQVASRLKRTVVGITIPGDDKAALFKTTVKAEEGSEPDGDKDGVENFKVFEGKKVLLSSQLGLSKTLKRSLETWVARAGGEVVEADKDLLSCDVFITPHRDGTPFLLAIKHHKLIGSLAWFYHVLKTGKLTSPKDQLLHYPVPSEPVSSFANYEISVTNYTGEAREYLKRLIGIMGAKFTTTLSSSNTHLVAAAKYGDKVARCRQWHIPCINHKWLEASFQEWRDADVSRPEYSSFPPGINFMTLLGETGLNDELLKKWTSPAASLGDVDVEVMMTQGEATELGDVEADVLGTREDVGEGPSRSATEVTMTPAKPKAVRKTKVLSADKPTTPLTTSRTAANTDAPPSSTKRSAATAAAQRLHDTIAPDMLKWEKEKKRNPNSKRARSDEFESRITTTRSRSPEKPQVEEHGSKRSKKKASVTPAADAEDEDGDVVMDGGKSESLLGDAKVRILVTGVVLASKERAAASIRNVSLTDVVGECTHLVTHTIKRTEKFLIAMANGPLIVNSTWLSDSASAGHLLDETPYFINDKDTENSLDFKLLDALQRAREIGQKGLFAGHTFYRTPNVETDLAVLKRIVGAHGGEVVKYTNARALEASPETKHVISAEKDKALWPAIRKLDLPIYSREVILVSILKMQLELDSHRL